MKRDYMLVVLLCVLSVFRVSAQDVEESDSKWLIGINVTAYDFYSPKLNQFSSFKKQMAFGPDINVTRNWFKTGLGLNINLASPSSSFLRKTDASLPAVNNYMLFFGPGLVYNFQNSYMIPAKCAVAPYLFANFTGSVAQIADLNNDVKFGFGIPVGAGINFKVADGVAINTRAGYAFGITDYYENNIFWSMGATLGIPHKKDVKEPEPFVPLPVDTDGDGIADESDDCPEVAGLAEFNGCPDTDGDGIPDKDDVCPEVAGLAQFNGCPDRDGDGVPDNLDECPDVAGLAKFKGCPEPDADGDGVPDSKDRCPNQAGPLALNGCPDRDGDGVADIDDRCPDVAGPVSNKGCPEVKEETKAKLQQIASSVKFESGKNVLKKESYALLDEVVKILNEYPAYSISVEGHTDATGTDAINDKLSEERAKVCADYLISKGIAADRVTSQGFGSKNPVADNKTPEGRAKNRRTEFKLHIK